MEKAKESLEASEEEAERVSSLSFTPHRLGVDVTSFYRYFSLRGIRVDRYRPGFISCTFKVPPRLTDKNGKLGSGAIATLVDEVGCATVYVEGLPFNVTVDITINYVSTAKLDVKASGSTYADPVSSPALSKSLHDSPIKMGILGSGAIATLVDEVGCAMRYVEGLPFNVTVAISITYLSTAKLHDELEITGRVLGNMGNYFGTSIVVKNKASGEIIADGRTSLYRNPINYISKILDMEVFRCFDFSEDKNGNLGSGAIATLVDEVGCAMRYVEGLPFNVTVAISITYLSTAKLHDELEITRRVLGNMGSYFGTSIVVKNKASGEIIADGRTSLYRNPINYISKM
nr:acyl-coenzyme A thioesterase 13-like [Ipomoea batatas]